LTADQSGFDGSSGLLANFPALASNRHGEGALSFAIGHDLNKSTLMVEFGAPTV
jgi:hypothetical protein